MLDNIEQRYILVGDVTLHVVLAGPEDGEPIILLHGFPEFWYGWKHQIPVLAEQGYRVIVPDQRGYNLSDKPRGVDAYQLDTLAEDVVGLADALGYDTFYLVGHDWGAAVAWWVATLHAERLRKLVILNVPYPTIMIEQMTQKNIGQFLKSWYIGFFQIPFMPETLASLGDYAGMATMLRQSSKPDTFSDADIEQYRRAWSQPDALKSMINWYRAMGSSAMNNNLSKPRRISTPTLMLWGEQDIALGKELAEPSIRVCDDGELIFYPNATHWLQHDEPQSVNEEILRFLRQTIPVEPTGA
ncbi:MAG: alpha/beta fold hydrolase [Anaerolineae bacterium]